MILPLNKGRNAQARRGRVTVPRISQDLKTGSIESKKKSGAFKIASLV